MNERMDEYMHEEVATFGLWQIWSCKLQRRDIGAGARAAVTAEIRKC